MLGHGIPGVAGFSTHSMAAGGGGGGAAAAALLGLGGSGSGGGGIGGGAMSVHSMGSMASMSMAEMHAMHAMMGMPMAATGAQALIHGGSGLASAGGGGGGLPTHASVSASLGGGSQATMLQLDPAQVCVCASVSGWLAGWLVMCSCKALSHICFPVTLFFHLLYALWPHQPHQLSPCVPGSLLAAAAADVRPAVRQRRAPAQHRVLWRIVN